MHEAGDEGLEYRAMLVEYARRNGVDMHFATRVSDVRQLDGAGRKMYTLWDLLPLAALITYPSLYEGFGNAFLEAVYFKIPVLINRYAIFHEDIEPKGFRVPVMEGFLTDAVVAEVRRLMEDESYRREAMEYNFKIGARHYSYAGLRRSLRTLIINLESLYPE